MHGHDGKMSVDNVKELVYEQYKKLNLANKKISWDLKQIELSNKCQKIIYNEWGMGTQGLWDAVDRYVEELIPCQYEEE